VTTLVELTNSEFVLVSEDVVSTVEIVGDETLVHVSEEVTHIVTEAVQGPQGPMADFASDPLAYYILAKS